MNDSQLFLFLLQRKCRFCGLEFDWESKLKDHEMVHTGMKFFSQNNKGEILLAQWGSEYCDKIYRQSLVKTPDIKTSK